VRSGISDYSADLLPALDLAADVRVVRMPDQPVASGLEHRWQPVDARRLGEDGRLPLYQMGNNLHHEAILGLAAAHPGVLTLHDLVLHHLLLSRTMGRGERFDEYQRALTGEHGWIGWEVARPALWGGYSESAQFALPAHRQLLRSQRGILVHSEWAAEQVREDDPEIRVRSIPMGVPLPERVDVREGLDFRHRLGIPDAASVLGSLGFQTPMKRTTEVIRALVRPELDAVHLIVAGEVAPILDLDRLVSDLGLGDRVHITGFLPYEAFHAAISACDLCLNLRYPTAGETSASMLRILAAGRAVIVSDYAQFRDLPETIAARVPLGDGEIEALARVVSSLLADPERRRRMGEAARDHIRSRHDPGATVTRLVEACLEWRELPPPARSAVDVRRPTSLTWSFFGGALEVTGADLPWRVGEARELSIRLTNQSFADWLPTRVGPGGMVVRVEFLDAQRVHLSRRRWLRVRRILRPGESVELTTQIRRPDGAQTLLIEPSVAGNSTFWDLHGPIWMRELDPA
jgi:glycosyltransferase involved in cell wall biosynthesis